MRSALAAVVLASAAGMHASACGRIGFEELGGADCALAVEPVTSSVNLNTSVPLVATDAIGAVSWAVTRGQGSVDESGVFVAGDRVEQVTIAATDSAACTAETSVDVRGSTLFYAGGVDGNTINVATVYASSNGTSWRAIGVLPGARTRGKLVVFQDRMWWLGGSGPEIWSTTDGISWRSESPMPATVNEFGSAVYRQRMWIVGGGNGANVDTVYSSPDGVTWQLAGHMPVALHGTKCLGFVGRLWCVGGHDFNGRFRRVFSSIDGATWIDEAPLSFEREEEGLIVLPDGRLMFIGGTDNNATAGTTYGAITSDGVTWITQGTLPNALYITDLVQLGSTIYLAGSQTEVMTTTDGATWTTVGALPAYRAEGGFVAFTPH